MQNQYFGDEGDFGKYFLLRSIQENSKLHLGINWYMNHEKKKNNDGKFIEYLKPSSRRAQMFKSIDLDLYHSLQTIVITRGVRDINEVRETKILRDFAEYQKPVPEKAGRDAWFAESIELFKKQSELLFLDPDNQVEVKRGSYSPKHVRGEEIKEYWKENFSLIIYNHRDRSKREEYLKKLWGVGEHLNLKGNPQTEIFEYSCGTQRHFIFVIQGRHKKDLDFLFRSETYPPNEDVFKCLNREAV